MPFFRRDGRAWCLAAIPIIALAWYGLIAIPTVTTVGPVYYTETIMPLLALTASGFERAVELVRHALGESRALAIVLLWPVAAVVAALLIFVPLQAASLTLMARVARAPYALVEARGLKNAVVFVDSLPANHHPPRSYAYFHRNNSTDLSDSVLFVHDLGPERNRMLLEYLPGRWATGWRPRERGAVPGSHRALTATSHHWRPPLRSQAKVDAGEAAGSIAPPPGSTPSRCQTCARSRCASP